MLQTSSTQHRNLPVFAALESGGGRRSEQKRSPEHLLALSFPFLYKQAPIDFRRRRESIEASEQAWRRKTAWIGTACSSGASPTPTPLRPLANSGTFSFPFVSLSLSNLQVPYTV